ncbi:MAG: DUF4363 family protein [Clostridiales bacterium]|nr:DUF4363 family protein [Clostridiales bacterium]
MRRAIVLITVMTLLGVSLGIWMEYSLNRFVGEYLEQAEQVRRLTAEKRLDQALEEQAYMHARWQGEVGWLNCLISHHHTREVNEALLKLTTSLEEGWRKESLMALDELTDALADIREGVAFHWQNIL